jgi:N-acetylglucosamine kinase-like BadF-type ATPase
MGAVLGVDGGGTKTHAAIADRSGTLLGTGTSGPSNWENVGLPEAAGAVHAAVREALGSAKASLGDVEAAVFGLAGLDWESDHPRLDSIAESLGLSGSWAIVNDAFVALRAGANHPWGVVIVAGSGTVVAGRNPEGEEFRTLGLGAMFGDWGSASDIAEGGVRAVADAHTGLGPPTALSEILPARFDTSTPAEFLERISRPWRPIPELAPVILEAAQGGDAVARAVAERAGTALGRAAGIVARRLGMDEAPVEFVLAGGVFRTTCRPLTTSLEREIRKSAPQALMLRLETPPVVGALLRALELLGEEPTGALHLRFSLDVMRLLGYGLRETPS